MKAILLAAGYGTRLRPLTYTIPKCLVPIKNVPLLQIWLDRLSEAGVDSFLINTHYLSEKVADFAENSEYRDKIILAHESELLGTAGTLIKNLNFFGEEDGMLIHADNYCLADLGTFIFAHKNRPKRCLMTIMTFRTDNPSSCGIVEVNEECVVTGFYEKTVNPPGNLANCAVYILSKEILSFIQKELSFAKDFSTEILPLFLGRVYTYETKELFMDIGTPEVYVFANI